MSSITADSIIYNCPHCELPIITYYNEINCTIFRHGFDTKQNEQIPPHSTQEECIRLSQSPDVVGCCKPYQIIKNNNSYVIQKCDYI